MIGISRLLSRSNIKNTELSMESLKSEKSELKRSIKELKRFSGHVKPMNGLINRFLGAKLSSQKINVRVRARFISSVQRKHGSSNEEINKKHDRLILCLSKSNSMALQRKTKLLNDIKSLKNGINKELTALATKKNRPMMELPVQRSERHEDNLSRNILFDYSSPKETMPSLTDSLLDEFEKALRAIKNQAETHIYINELNANGSSLIRESGNDSGYDSPAEASDYLPMGKFRTHGFGYLEMNSQSKKDEHVYEEIK